jgi:hypothetical protein
MNSPPDMIRRPHNWATRAFLALFVLVVVVCCYFLLRRPLARLDHRRRAKITISHISQVGQICLAQRPSLGSCGEILRHTGINISSEVCEDGWGKPLAIKIESANGSPSYLISTGSIREHPDYVWRNGTWIELPPDAPP